MIPIDKIMGRLGNKMFMFAFLYAYARNNDIDYYYQDPTFFEGYEEDIKQLFGSGIKPVDMVSIHVRRGDYVGNRFYSQLWNTDYYEKAIEMFPGSEFLVFSDDIEWCKAHHLFSGKEFAFCEEEDEVKAMNLMAGCKHNIISNSSFSWWAAFLNPNGNKKIIAPKEWYADGEERTKLPDNWVRL